MAKIGLVFGGGGAKGAYQVGVYQALKEFGLTKKIKFISANSIGAINLLALCNDDVTLAYNLWTNLKRSDVLTFKSFKNFFKKDNFSLFSREGMLEIIKDVDIDKVSKCKRTLFVAATNETLDQPEYFKLNGLAKDEILNIVLASSAIPTVFEQVKINDYYYSDGVRYSNVPIDILKKQGCKFLYVIPLSDNQAPYEGMDNDITIIDFNYEGFKDLGIINGTLGFDKKLALERYELGYNLAKEMILYLKKEGVIATTFLEKLRSIFKKKKKYYSYKDVKREV